MSENLDSNPFTALFSSMNDAESFAQQQIQHLSSAENAVEVIPETDNPVSNVDDLTVSLQAKECLEVNRLVEDVFNVTLNNHSRSGMINDLVFLEELSTAVAPQDWIDIETLEHALFERLLLEDPARQVIGRNVCGREGSSPTNMHATQKEVITYLFECHRRLAMKSGPENNCHNKLISQMLSLVLRNAATALRQPALFESQELHSQILQLVSDNSISKTDLCKFFDGLVKQFVLDDGEVSAVDTLCLAFTSTLDTIHSDLTRSNLFTFNRSYLSLLHIFSSNSQLGSVLIVHSTPKDSHLGLTYADTLLGSILSLSCLPKVQDGPYEFFEKPSLQVASVTEGNIWTATEAVIENLYMIFHALLKHSNEVRHQTLCWLADCLHANVGRGKLWNSHGLNIGASSYVSDGFMLNLTGVLLRLCQPFCSDTADPMLLRVDPTYCASEVSDDAEMRSKGVHMKKMASETCLIPAPEDTPRPLSETYGFISECFYLAHKALDLGFKVTFEQLMRLNQDLARIQRAFIDAQNQAGANSDVVQTIGERMELEMTRYLSLRAALLEPQSLSRTAQLLVATAVWLVQVTLDVNSDQSPRKYYTPTQFRTVEFPLPQEVPATLSPRTLEEQGFALLDPILTQVLVFMGSPQRMRNPHLRAHMAECLESLLPHHDEEPPALNPNPLGSFYRERLFKAHPHRKQIVESLLDVFVGIEMTGQSVAFEQKFKYRRPMYILMDYLWQIEEHAECFQNLATEAEANMEAVTPPLFLRFLNLLMNDAVFLLDEALSNMAQLRQMQTAREAGEWQQLPIHEREQNEGYLQHIGMIARFDNILGRETIHTLEFLTSKITSIFSHPTMVDRIAAMLNYFLFHLVGPKKRNFKVKDQKEYEFNPAKIVMDICKIYVHLHESDSFCLAVSQDGRSYSPHLFTYAEDVLARIGGGALIADVQAVALKVAQMASQQQTDDEILAEAPEEFLDPIMSTLMRDPVILPSSHTTVDRSTIARHLLSDQTDPFNRSALTMDMVKPHDELRLQIEAWIKEKKQQRQTQASDSNL
ncbi:ubiquitin conjugation factor E4 A isoform X2 [Cryptotermes secundus]|uniref:ubiquitin conjugation factor E4 A isoform X2 n=1 Tax=Cryptotermes secundus TaxID=105785 RepID=UPI000CD7C3F5|nr:ubiquitin conjugation factor E4 A isoform X2 [Cryptotermes secundus]